MVYMVAGPNSVPAALSMMLKGQSGLQSGDTRDAPAISEFPNGCACRVFGAGHAPRTADHQSLSSIKVGHAALSSDIVLIVVNHLPSDR